MPLGGQGSESRQEEVFAVLEGQATIVADDTEHPAPAGTFVRYGPEVKRTVRNDSDAKIRVRASSDQPLKVIMRPGHPLSDRPSLTIADLARERLALPEGSFRIRQTLRIAETEEHIFLNPVLVSNSLLALKAFARSGLGVTVLPAIAAHSEVAAGTLRSVPIDHPTLMHTSASVITRLGRQLPVGAVRLQQKIEATMPFLPAS